MDWFSWLSRTSLEPSLIYEYGLAFSRNELRLEDATHFNHEFLQSMGVSIAKHRLEIIKLAKKERDGGGGAAVVRSTKKLSGAIKKCLRKCLSKLVLPREQDGKDMMALPPEPNWCQGKRRGPMHRSRTIALSGPLDGRMQHERMVSSSKMLKLSGPLDGSTNRSPIMARPVLEGRFLGTARSPRLSGPFDAATPPMVHNRSPWLTRPSDERAESPMGYSPYHNKIKGDSDFDECGLWPTLFEDLKPT